MKGDFHARFCENAGVKLPLRDSTVSHLIWTHPNLRMDLPKVRIEIASDVNERDGIGVEIYRNDKLVTEIFQEDTSRTRTVTVFKSEVSLELIEEVISEFKKEIPWDFIRYGQI